MPKTNIQGQTKQIHPKVFALWLGLGSVIMMFAGLTSAHIVRKAQGNWVEYRIILGTTSFLGLGFLVTQVLAWKELTSYGILLNGNPSGSFLYLISGLHLFHVLGGVVAMLILFIKAFSLNHDPISQAKRSINPNNGLGLKLMSIYWHFIGILWIYLLAFLSFT
ncbi:MAG TPA: cytochrome c oxidase subunit 3 [Chitinophagales bacterium]|nr:cytochrome c oxidase subunit 3 [Chitinophagales bacterium]